MMFLYVCTSEKGADRLFHLDLTKIIPAATAKTVVCPSISLLSVKRILCIVNLSSFTIPYKYVEKETPIWQA